MMDAPQTTPSRADIDLAIHYMEEYDYDPHVRRVMRFLAALYATAPGPDPEPDRNHEWLPRRMAEMAAETGNDD